MYNLMPQNFVTVQLKTDLVMFFTTWYDEGGGGGNRDIRREKFENQAGVRMQRHVMAGTPTRITANEGMMRTTRGGRSSSNGRLQMVVCVCACMCKIT